MFGFPQREVALVGVNDLIETEEHCSEIAVELAKKIIDTGFWTVPIAVEANMMAIMDGHHRLNAAKYLGLSRVPCVVMTYENGGVSLKSWRNDVVCRVADIRSMVARLEKYPLKTTRHVFNPSIDEIKIPLELLY
tara:strand:- start:1249 stop:1653 length:405 start_codon:yes stop_codon:yes gene_type:complete